MHVRRIAKKLERVIGSRAPLQVFVASLAWVSTIEGKVGVQRKYPSCHAINIGQPVISPASPSDY